jgi:hypothetical protein
MAEKKYINSIYFKEFTFEKGGSILNISLYLQKFYDELLELVNEKGYVNLSVAQRKEKGKYGETHYCYFKSFEKKETPPKLMETKKDDDELPF